VPFIRLQIGRDITADELRNDWVLVHEMVHLAVPEVGDDHLWFTEGLSTYIEGIARVQAGDLPAERVWTEQIRSMPKGLPGPGDKGLDRTHTWGRTYWGGALFCLLADVEIRKKTSNRLGLRDAMRAVLRETGGVAFNVPIERVLKIGDGATNTTVLQDLYAQMKDKPFSPDLPELWQQLGIRLRGESLELENDAPLAATRDAIMTP
jgi:predicted metalloprotease with PDZ domain